LQKINKCEVVDLDMNASTYYSNVNCNPSVIDIDGLIQNSTAGSTTHQSCDSNVTKQLSFEDNNEIF